MTISAELAESAVPDLSDVMSSRVDTVRFVPISFRNEWSEVVGHALDNCATAPDNLKNWTRLLMLPKCILKAPRRGGKSHAPNNCRDNRQRIKSWKEGNISDLWSNATKRPKERTKKNSKPSPDFNVRRAKELAGLGQFGRAAKALFSDGLVSKSDESLKDLLSLHPSADPPVFSGRDESPLAYQVESEFVHKSLKSFPSGTAAGPSRWFPEHFVHAVECPTPQTAARTLESLNRVVNILAAGQAPSSLSPWLCSANLFATAKPKGGVRPIAVGEVLRRLTAKCLAKAANAEARDFLCPHQLGVATSGGSEAIVHATKMTVKKCSEHGHQGVLTVDFENAFNTLDRTEILLQVRNRLPGLSAFVEFTYGHYSRLLFEDVILNSEKGVQQGDPLGPLIFAVTLHSLVESLKSEVPGLTLNCWYLDDGICAGDEDSLLKALEFVTSNGLHLGLKVKHSKCELWAPVEFLSIPVSIPRAASNGFELLGAPIGDTEFSVKVLDKRISKATKCLEKLPLLDDPQLSLGITRTCLAAPKLTYSLRTQPPSQPVAASLQVFDELLRDALSVIVGSPVPDLAWSQSSLPIKDGGFGVRQARDQHIPAFLGSSCQSAHLVSFLTECDITDTPEFLRASNDFREHSESVNTPGFTQEAFQEKLDKATYNAFFSSLPDSREQARLQSLSLPYAGAWLTAVPIKGLGLHLLPAEFQAAVRYRLGLPVFKSARRCPACPSGILDVLGDHAVACGGSGGRISRHDRLRDIFFNATTAASLAPIKEQRNLIPGERSKPGDIFVPTWSAGRPAAFDVTVTSPLQLSLLSRAAETPGASLEVAEDRKFSKHEKNCEEQGISFFPLAVETLGGRSALAIKTLKSVAILADARRSGSRDARVAPVRLLQSLSVCLMRGNATIIVSRAI